MVTNNKKKKPTTGKKKANKQVETDWISALAKEASTASNSATNIILSKKGRIDKRNAKKRRREERRGETDAVRLAQHRNRKANEDNVDPEELRIIAQHYLGQLSQNIQETVNRINEGKSHKEKRFAKPFSPAVAKGKATAGQQLSDNAIQPRKKDYGGLGLARPSLLIDLRDISFVPKLEEEFMEHVPGFFGKQRTKAMKRQLDGNMLWRRLADKKNGKGGNKKTKNDMNIKVDGKKLSDMSPDERVEAMIKLDMI